jgi:hypothetical protein
VRHGGPPLPCCRGELQLKRLADGCDQLLCVVVVLLLPLLLLLRTPWRVGA